MPAQVNRTHVDEEVRPRRRREIVAEATQAIVLLVEGLIRRAEVAKQVFGRRLAELDLDLPRGLGRRCAQLKLERGGRRWPGYLVMCQLGASAP